MIGYRLPTFRPGAAVCPEYDEASKGRGGVCSQADGAICCRMYKAVCIKGLSAIYQEYIRNIVLWVEVPPLVVIIILVRFCVDKFYTDELKVESH